MEDLKQHLQSLHMELQSNQAMDPATLEALRIVAEDIRAHLESAGQVGTTPSSQSLSKRLEGMVNEFEVQHPRLTSIVSQIAERLADMGI